MPKSMLTQFIIIITIIMMAMIVAKAPVTEGDARALRASRRHKHDARTRGLLAAGKLLLVQCAYARSVEGGVGWSGARLVIAFSHTAINILNS